MTAVSAASRDPWLDNVKMVLVTLVVMGHAIGLVEGSTESHWTYDFVYLWHIPAFVLKLHWLFLPASVVVSLAGGLWNTDYLMIPRFLGLLPFFTLGLFLQPHHLKRLDDVWVRIAGLLALIGIGVMAGFVDVWADTAILWYDAGYDEVPIDNVVAFQTRLTVMALGLIGTFSVLALVSRRNLGWFTAMGTATMVIYLFHGFAVKTAKALGWPDFTSAYPVLGLVLTLLGAIAIALLLATPPVRRVLEPFTNPLGWWESRRGSDQRSAAPTSA